MTLPLTLTRQQVRDLDRRAIEEYGFPGIVLMENAGRGCAELLMKLNPLKKPTLILCGPGNNGGDGFVIARHLDNHDWPVRVHCVAANRSRPPDAQLNQEIVAKTDMDSYFTHPDYVDPSEAIRTLGIDSDEDWIVDALFGTGLTRPLGPPYSVLVERVNASGKPVFAVDIPSGLDCDTGEPLGTTIRATHTGTFVAPKRGFPNPKSKDWTGEVHVLDIGVPKKLIMEYAQPDRAS
jgi:NAD(P)H-hydrate epimerase